MEQLFSAGKAYLKINSLVKTPLHEFMAVERSGLWAPAQTHSAFYPHSVLYSFINLTILDFLHSVEIAFFLFSFFFPFLFMCTFVVQCSCWPVIKFYLLLMSTGCLAPLAPMVIPGSHSSTLIFTFNIRIVVIYFWARVRTNKEDWLIG